VPTLNNVLGALAIAVISVSGTLLATNADHDLIRSAAMIGCVLGIAVGQYLMVDRRMTRVERLTARGVQVEQDVLVAMRDREHARLN